VSIREKWIEHAGEDMMFKNTSSQLRSEVWGKEGEGNPPWPLLIVELPGIVDRQRIVVCLVRVHGEPQRHPHFQGGQSEPTISETTIEAVMLA
jgi:hypothetical protein